MLQKLLFGAAICSIVVISGIQLKHNSDVCWKRYVDDVQACRGSIDEVENCANKAWAEYLESASGDLLLK